MNRLLIFLVFAILSLSKESLSSRFHAQNSPDFEQILVQSFKKKLLRELGFSSVPNVSALKAPKIPSIYRHLVEAENSKFKQPIDEDEDDFHAKTKRIFLFSEQVASAKDTVEKNYVFKSTSEHANLESKSATLWVHITETHKSDERTIHEMHELSLYKSFQALGKDVRAKELVHTEQLNVPGWHSIKVSAVVKEWFSLPEKLNLSFDIAMNGATSLEVIGADDATGPMQPFLAVDTEEKKRLDRKRREINIRELRECPSKPPKTCCLHDLEINFNEIEWYFIVFPESLNISACEGSCESHAHHMDPSRSKALRLANREQDTCCRPHRLAPVSIIYFDKERQINKATIPNMRVLSCRCIV